MKFQWLMLILLVPILSFNATSLAEDMEKSISFIDSILDMGEAAVVKKDFARAMTCYEMAVEEIDKRQHLNKNLFDPLRARAVKLYESIEYEKLPKKAPVKVLTSSVMSMVDATKMTILKQEITINASGDTYIMGDGQFGPNKKQRISYNFSISKYKVTNAWYAEFINDDGYTTREFWTANGWKWKGQCHGQPSRPCWGYDDANPMPRYWDERLFNKAEQPIVGINWYEAVAFMNWLSSKEGSSPVYDENGMADLDATGYRLPTELEWEYTAAKGDATSQERYYAYGDRYDCSKQIAGDASCGILMSTQEVGKKSPLGDSPQGIVEITGNVWEWCSDNYQDNQNISSMVDRYYYSADRLDSLFSLRGGSWFNCCEPYFRASNRYYFDVSRRNAKIGFRLLRRLK